MRALQLAVGTPPFSRAVQQLPSTQQAPVVQQLAVQQITQQAKATAWNTHPMVSMMTASTRQVNEHTSILTTAPPATTAVSMRLPGAELQLSQKMCSGLGCLSMQLVHCVLPDKGQASVTALLTGLQRLCGRMDTCLSACKMQWAC